MTLNIAHRGYSSKYPENTLLAFKAALEVQCDGIELDLQMTKDGKVIVFHDEELGRTVPAHGFIKDYTWNELKDQDAGYLFHHLYGKQKIPTLEEYFTLIKDKKILSLLELKNNMVPYVGLEEKVIALIRDFDLFDQVIISSFNPNCIRKCHLLAPQIKTALLRDTYVTRSYYETRKTGANFLNLRHYYLLPYWMPWIRHLKIPIMAWTVNKPRRLKQLVRANIHGIITNDPFTLSKIIAHEKSKE